MSSQNSTEKEPENTWDNLDDGVKQAVIALRDFARQKEKDFQFVLSLNSTDLGCFLKEFYLALRDNSSEDDVSATVSHLSRVRSDLKDYFMKMTNVNITNGNEFSECNAVVDQDIQGKEVVTKPVTKKHTRQRTFTFETSELRQIYMGDAMNLDLPESLQNKVFFDVCMYICNRGKDFLRLMSKNDFDIGTDQNGRRYVWLKYDSKFSFQEVAGGMTCDGTPATQIGERMFERPGDPKCPLLSYTKYAIHLHPMSDAFWQRPKRNVLATDFVWFDNICIGNSTLNKLMNRITQSAGLQDSYAINAIKSSYIPIIESICRSALFGSQQFRRILQMKQANEELHHVRKRHSEGSLSIARTLRESTLFNPRLSESHLPIYRLQHQSVEAESTSVRSSSASPVSRESGGWEAGSPHMLLQNHNAAERRESPDNGYHAYRNSPAETEAISRAGYKQTYSRETSQEGSKDNSLHGGMGYKYNGEEEKKTLETGSILHSKQKCLDIVHSLEVRDIKSFINWMKTFEVKHGSAGLMVTCQPVNASEGTEHQLNRPFEQNGNILYSDVVKKEQSNYSQYEKLRQDSVKEKDRFDFDAKQLEFNCIGETYCCTSDLSPLKITIPTQETVLLTGLKSSSQVLIHNKREDENQSLDRKYCPLHTRIFTSNDNYNLEQIDNLYLRQNSYNNGVKHDQNYAYDNSARSNANCGGYKEEKSIPMKKRVVMDQSEHSPTQAVSQSPPSTKYPQSRSPPASFPQHTSPQHYMPHPGYVQSTAPPTQTVPKYRERFPDGWGYIPLQKRQKFGVPVMANKDDLPLDLIKQP